MEFDYRLLFKIESFLILLLLFLGLYLRKDRIKHVRTMLTAIVLDLILVLQIELSRGAINQAINPNKNSLLLNIHITIAVSTVLLYFFMLYSGFKLKNGEINRKKLHVKVGFFTIFLRILNFATSLFVS